MSIWQNLNDESYFEGKYLRTEEENLLVQIKEVRDFEFYTKPYAEVVFECADSKNPCFMQIHTERFYNTQPIRENGIVVKKGGAWRMRNLAIACGFSDQIDGKEIVKENFDPVKNLPLSLCRISTKFNENDGKRYLQVSEIKKPHYVKNDGGILIDDELPPF